jgi:hypothetical protein
VTDDPGTAHDCNHHRGTAATAAMLSLEDWRYNEGGYRSIGHNSMGKQTSHKMGYWMDNDGIMMDNGWIMMDNGCIIDGKLMDNDRIMDGYWMDNQRQLMYMKSTNIGGKQVVNKLYEIK